MRRRSGFGWFDLIIGILLVLLGILTFVRPGMILTGLLYLYGIIAVVMGIADILLYIRVERYTSFGPIVSMVSGILSVMAGVMLLVYPGTGVMVLSLLLPIWFIAHCISRLSHLSMIRVVSGNGAYYFSLILNIIGLILGFMMILRPWFSLAATGWIIGLYLILLGIDSIIMGLGNMGMRR